MEHVLSFYTHRMPNKCTHTHKERHLSGLHCRRHNNFYSYDSIFVIQFVFTTFILCANVTAAVWNIISEFVWDVRDEKRSRKSLKRKHIFAIRFTSIIFDIGQFLLFFRPFFSCRILCKMMDARKCNKLETYEVGPILFFSTLSKDEKIYDGFCSFFCKKLSAKLDFG